MIVKSRPTTTFCRGFQVDERIAEEEWHCTATTCADRGGSTTSPSFLDSRPVLVLIYLRSTGQILFVLHRMPVPALSALKFTRKFHVDHWHWMAVGIAGVLRQPGGSRVTFSTYMGSRERSRSECCHCQWPHHHTHMHT